MKALALPALCLALATSAQAMVRMAVIIGNNQGLPAEKPLQFATRDAQQIDAVLGQLGGVDKGYGYLLLDANVSDVYQTFGAAREKVRVFRRRGERVQLLIYFSGHGSEEALHLNGRKLPLADIRQYFKDVEADLKLLIADACFSGALLQAKGATLAPPVPVRYNNELNVNGSAILTSSSAGEFSQESKELQGSLFTHYFISALRGAADFDRDGRVTLWEAYSQTKTRLSHRLAASREGAQTPSFDMDIKGSDNVVLTRLDQGQASLVLRGLPRGDYRILDAANGHQAAEVNLDDPRGLTLSVQRAAYRVYHVDDGVGVEAYADLSRDRRLVLGPEDFRPSTYGALAAKGQAPLGLAAAFARASMGYGHEYSEEERPSGSRSEAPQPGFEAGTGTLEMASAAGREAARLSSHDGLKLSMYSRYYHYFPGRPVPAVAWSGAVDWRSDGWGVSAGYALLPRRRQPAGRNTYEQGAQSLSLEARYYWIENRHLSAFGGPRVEAWLIEQSLNGHGIKPAQVVGAFALLGVERDLFRFLSLELSLNAGAFLQSDGMGRPMYKPAMPVSASMRFGL